MVSMKFQLGHAIRKGGFPTALLALLFSGFATGGNMELTQDRVRELFDYREDGCLIRKSKPDFAIGASDIKGPYYKVRVGDVCPELHRVIFLYHKGYMPEEVDHINRDKKDNRIENLRPSTRSENEINKGLRSNNSSGKSGVYFSSSKNTWRAMVKVRGQKINLGSFKKKSEAISARLEAELKYYGEYTPA